MSLAASHPALLFFSSPEPSPLLFTARPCFFLPVHACRVLMIFISVLQRFVQLLHVLAHEFE